MPQSQAVSTIQQSGSLDPADQQREGRQMGALIRTHAAHRGMMKKDEFYSPQKGKIAPTARALQKMANAQNISSEVVRVEWKNEDSIRKAMCTAYVRAWVGSRSRPRQEQTEALTLLMPAIAQKYAIKKLNSKYEDSKWRPDDVLVDEGSGRMWPVSKRHQMEMLSYLADQYAFLERSAITKCQSRVFDKLLRPDAEIHYGDEEDMTAAEGEEYDAGHETALPPSGSGTDTDDEPEARDGSKDSGGDAPSPSGPAGEDPPATAEDARKVMEQDSFPPSPEQIADHEERAERRADPPAPPKREPVVLSRHALTIAADIDAAGGSKAALEKLSEAIKASKDALPAQEYAQVMEHFYNNYRLAK